MKISVIICTKDRKEDLLKAIHTIGYQTRQPEELIIVDSTNEPRISEKSLAESFSFKIKYINTIPGLTYQRNIGIELSIGEVIFFFDDDVLLEPKYLENIEHVYLRDKRMKIGAVSGRILNYNNNDKGSIFNQIKKEVHDFISNIFLLQKIGDGKFLLSGNPTHPHKDNFSHDIECLSGCCMSFRKDVFSHARFDEKLTGYSFMEDIDISKQVLNSGYKIFYSATACLIHNVSKVGRGNEKSLYEMIIRNQIYLFRKHWSKNFQRRIAFIWSLIGFFILNFHHQSRRQGMIRALLHKNNSNF